MSQSLMMDQWMILSERILSQRIMSQRILSEVLELVSSTTSCCHPILSFRGVITFTDI